jgi:carbon-monoxide dehydrogenase small subunit/xanthine dehydrogenase small subunit
MTAQQRLPLDPGARTHLAAETATDAPTAYQFTVNGQPVSVTVPGGRRLLDVLRLDLGLTGAKEGCGEGECGACSVLLDGALVDSCMVPVCQVAGHQVRTVEGLATDGRLDPLQAAFLETGGVQCGICTPGMLMAGRAFLDSGSRPTDEAIREAISGNLCRCTGYGRIVEAIRLAAENPDLPAVPPPPDVLPLPAAPGPRPADSIIDLDDPPAVTPRTLDAAYALLAERRWRPLAGGTDALVERSAGKPDDRGYLDLGALEALRGIRLEADTLVLGAATTYAELRQSPLIAEHLPVLAEMAREVGAAQIQNRGTLGGNIATASPAGDSLPVLLALDADFVLGSSRGERTVAASAFFTSYRRTALADDELLLRIRVPLPTGRAVAFRKVGTRRAQSISVVSIALAWRADTDGRWHEVRLALGSVAPTPIRAASTEALLEGARPTRDLAVRASAALKAEISPIDDVRSTAAYRRAAAGRVLERIIRDAADQ